MTQTLDSELAGAEAAGPRSGRREEVANAISHGLAVPLGIAGLCILVACAALRGTSLHVTTCAVYGSSVVLLFCASTLYHSVWHPPTKKLLRFVDHACVYVLIAGTYTPFLLVNLGDTLGWTMFWIVWGGAALGIVFKLKCTGRFEILSTITYLALGWLLLVVAEPLLAAIPPGGMPLLLAGGLAYTLGVVFYYFDEKIRYGHLVWHLFVLAGATLHYLAVLLYVIPAAPS